MEGRIEPRWVGGDEWYLRWVGYGGKDRTKMSRRWMISKRVGYGGKDRTKMSRRWMISKISRIWREG